MTDSVLPEKMRDRPVTWASLEKAIDLMRSEIRGARFGEGERNASGLLHRSMGLPDRRPRLSYNITTGRWEALR